MVSIQRILSSHSWEIKIDWEIKILTKLWLDMKCDENRVVDKVESRGRRALLTQDQEVELKEFIDI